MNVANPDQAELMDQFIALGQKIRKGELNVGRQNYALSLAHGVNLALHCGFGRLSAIELGVGTGAGLFDLCKAAQFYRDLFEIEIDVWGFDTGKGLPHPVDFRDHPEIWQNGQFPTSDIEHLRSRLPTFARLVVGDVATTLDSLLPTLECAPLGFVALDLDYYSSTASALRLFSWGSRCYLPAVPMYVDDVEVLLTYNSWCGEAAAIADFNANHALRKIERKQSFDIHNFHVCHILDHPIRGGETAPRMPLELRRI